MMCKLCISIFLIIIIILASPTVLAAVDSEDYAPPGVRLATVSRDEYLKAYADKNGVSAVKADELDKAGSDDDYKAEKATNASVLHLGPVYKEITAAFDIGGYGDIWAALNVRIVAKYNKFSVDGSAYQKFSDAIVLSADAVGAGSPSWSTLGHSLVVFSDEKFSNSLRLLIAGNYSTVLGASLSGDAANLPAGFIVTPNNNGSKCDIYCQFESVISSMWTQNEPEKTVYSGTEGSIDIEFTRFTDYDDFLAASGEQPTYQQKQMIENSLLGWRFISGELKLGKTLEEFKGQQLTLELIRKNGRSDYALVYIRKNMGESDLLPFTASEFDSDDYADKAYVSAILRKGDFHIAHIKLTQA